MPVDLNTARTPGEKTADGQKEIKLKKACADFEAMLVFQLMKTMRKTIPKSGLVGGSYGKDTYEMMLDQKVADEMAKKGQGLGLQTMLFKQISKQYLKKD